MKPIEIKISGDIQKSPQEICSAILDTNRWTEFTGYSILPGIESAHFETKTQGIVGSRISVKNKDGSSHIEEIIEWDAPHQVAMKFQDFNGVVKNLASHFIETWSFQPSDNGTRATRMMAFYPKGIWAWLVLFPISRLMKTAFEQDFLKQGGKLGT